MNTEMLIGSRFEAGTETAETILNPKTGKSVHDTRSATVIGPDATTTDALSTTLFVLGWEKAMQLLKSLPGIDAVIIDSGGKLHYSSGLEPARPPEP